MTDDTAAAKAVLRARVLKARAAMAPAERIGAGATVSATLLGTPEIVASRTLVVFAPVGTEIPIDAFVEDRIAAGVGVFLPYVHGDDLAVARIRDLRGDVAPGWRGVREPLPERRRPARVDRVETFIVPGVAFDTAGVRLGYGGGHFDRLLARADPAAMFVGVAFDAQIVAQVPAQAHDVRVHRLVTERRTVWCRLPPSA